MLMENEQKLDATLDDVIQSFNCLFAVEMGIPLLYLVPIVGSLHQNFAEIFFQFEKT